MSYTTTPTKNSASNICAGPALITLLAVQIIVGYEWLASGITKVASGTFVSGMAAALKEKDDKAAHWYKTFINDSIIPNAHTFAVLIEVGEIMVGVGFIAAAIVWLTRWSRLSDRLRTSVLATVMLAAVGSTFMAINFHLVNGGNHPWLIPKEGFDETIDLDMMLVMIQGAFFVFSGYLLLKIRREHNTAGSPSVHGALPEPS